jgi:hypothetical protein
VVLANKWLPGYRSVALVPVAVPLESSAEPCSVEYQDDHMAFSCVGAPSQPWLKTAAS